MVASAEAHECATGGLQTWKAMRDGNAHNCLGDSVPVVVNSSGNSGVLCLVQKAASTTFKELVLKALHVGGFPDPDGHFRADPHHPPRHLPVVGASPTWQRLLEERPNAPRFMIVRHPHSRLLSGYLDNVLSNEDRAKWPRGFESRDQGFTAFVRAVVEDDQLNPHFELQTKHCEAAHVDYEILRLEEQRVWFGRFACALGLQDAASSGWAADSGPFWRGTAECFDSACGCEPFVCEREREGPGCAAATSGGDATVHVTGASHLLQEYYTDQIAELVNTWARPDLERFGYRPFVPSEQHRELFWVPPQPPPPRTSPTMPVPPPTLSPRPLAAAGAAAAIFVAAAAMVPAGATDTDDIADAADTAAGVVIGFRTGAADRGDLLCAFGFWGSAQVRCVASNLERIRSRRRRSDGGFTSAGTGRGRGDVPVVTFRPLLEALAGSLAGCC